LKFLAYAYRKLWPAGKYDPPPSPGRTLLHGNKISRYHNF